MEDQEAEKETMTVKELIAELQKQDPEALVYSEGCDCTGDVQAVEADEGSKTVELKRYKYD